MYRFSLFLLGIIYFPLFRDIIVTYECDSARKFLRLYTNQTCPHNIKQAPPMYYIAIAFGVLYAVAIPLLFIIIIQRDSSFVYRDYGIDQENKELNKKKEKLKQIRSEHGKSDPMYKELQKYITEKGKELWTKYNDAIKEHNSAASVLYVSYKYYFRFYKIFQLFERIILCCLASFLFTQTKVQVPVGMSVIFVYGALSLILRPYQDPLTTIVDVCTHITIVVNMIFAYLLVRQDDIVKKHSSWHKLFKDNVASAILYTINGLNILVLVSALIIHPIRLKIQQRLWYKKRMAKSHEMREFIRENNEELNSTHVVRENRSNSINTANTPVYRDDNGLLQSENTPSTPLQHHQDTTQVLSNDLKLYSGMSHNSSIV
jgi:hypothetical protein